MTSNYDIMIRDRIRSINQNLINHKRKVGQGAIDLHIPVADNLVDLSNLEDIKPNEGTGRKITGKGRSGGMGTVVNGSLSGSGFGVRERKIGGKKRGRPVKKGKGTAQRSTASSSTPASSTPPAWNPKPEDYLSKVQLDVMDANDRKNFKLHPDWWGVYKPSKQTISPSEYLSLTQQEKDNLKLDPNLVHGDFGTNNKRLDPSMLAQMYGLEQGDKMARSRDDDAFVRNRDERLKEQADEDARNAPSAFDTFLGIASKVVPVVMGLGKPKKRGKIVKNIKVLSKMKGGAKPKKVARMKGGMDNAEIQADIARRKAEAMHQNELDDEHALSIMTPAQKAELALMNTPLTAKELAGGKKVKAVKPKTGNGNNPWISHVKSYALKHKLKYNDALKDPKCKSSYKK